MKLFYLLFTAILIYVLSGFAKAQSPDWIWANSIGGSSNINAYAIAVDDFANVYTTGFFQGTTDFDPGIGTFNLTSTIFDMFISKTDSAGHFIWAKQISGPQDAYGYAIALDDNGNVYTTGYFYGTADFDPGVGVFNLTTTGITDMFISKLDSSGNFVWAKKLNGALNAGEFGTSIAIDNSGNVYTAGYFMDAADFDPDPTGTYILTATASTSDIFILKLDASGNFIWAKSIGGISDDKALSIVLDSVGNVYTTGLFQQTVDFDPGIGVFNLTSFGGVFISKLDSSGNFIWARAMAGAGYTEARSIALDPFGNIFTTGVIYSGTIDFDPGSGIYNLTAAVTAKFISKLNNSGDFVWAKQIGLANNNLTGISIAVDPSGSVYTTGYFDDDGTVDFDPGSGTFNMTSNGVFDIFVCKLDSSGNFGWAKGVGGINSELGESIALDGSGNVFVAGFYGSPSISFGSIMLTNVNAPFEDMFIAKLDTVILTGNNELIEFRNAILLYPNPANNHFNIILTSDNQVEVVISDLAGKIFHPAIYKEGPKIQVNTNDLEDGIYFVHIRSTDFVETRKIVVVK